MTTKEQNARKMRAVMDFMAIKTVQPSKEAKALMGKRKKLWKNWEESTNVGRLLINGWAGLPAEERELAVEAIAEQAQQQDVFYGAGQGNPWTEETKARRTQGMNTKTGGK